MIMLPCFYAKPISACAMPGERTLNLSLFRLLMYQSVDVHSPHGQTCSVFIKNEVQLCAPKGIPLTRGQQGGGNLFINHLRTTPTIPTIAAGKCVNVQERHGHFFDLFELWMQMEVCNTRCGFNLSRNYANIRKIHEKLHVHVLKRYLQNF